MLHKSANQAVRKLKKIFSNLGRGRSESRLLPRRSRKGELQLTFCKISIINFPTAKANEHCQAINKNKQKQEHNLF